MSGRAAARLHVTSARQVGALTVGRLLGELSAAAAEDPWSYYWLPAYAALAAVLLLALLPARPARVWRRGLPPLFVAACTVALAALRWPVLLGPQPYNVDEVQFGATALSLVGNPSLGMFLEAGTSGPLNYWYLAAPAAFGLQIDLASGRLMALACEAVMVAGCYGAMRNAYGDTIARLATLGVVAMLGFVRSGDFVHPSSEHVPVALAGLGSWMLARAMRARPQALPALMLGLGTVAGAMPFAKLQALPLALTMVGFGAVVALRQGHRGARVTPLAALLVGTSAFGVASAAYLVHRGRLSWFLDIYFRMNLLYVERGQSLGEALHALSNPLTTWTGLGELRAWFAYSAALLCVTIGRLAIGRMRDPAARPFALYAVALLGAGVVAVVTPGRPYPHYLLLLVPGLLLGAAGALASRGATLTRLCLLPLPALIFALGGLSPGPVVNAPSRPPVHPLLRRVRSEARPDDRLTVWGWASWIHLQSGLPQGTYYQVPYWALAPNPRRRYFRALWLREFKRMRPDFFVDAVARGEMWSDPEDRHESLPALRAWVLHAYEPFDEVDGRRVYRLRSRADATATSPRSPR